MAQALPMIVAQSISRRRTRPPSGQKAPLQPKEVWAIPVRLQVARRMRDLAHFNLAIDSKLRGCDFVRLEVGDVARSVHDPKCTLARSLTLPDNPRDPAAADSDLTSSAAKPHIFPFHGTTRRSMKRISRSKR